MSCQSTPISTRWTTTTSNIPATGTVIHTSIITPKPTISTSLLTSCLSTRSTLPTAGLHVSTKRTKRKSSSSNGTNNDLVLDTSTTKERHHERFLLVERQVRVPSGLPSDCVSWTIRPVLSTATPPFSTSLGTSTTISTTQTTIWVPGETIWAGCEGSTSAKPSGDIAAVSSSTATVDTSSTPTGSASINAETNSSAVRTESPSVEILSSSAQQLSSSQISAPESSSSSSREWIDETTRLNSMASVLSAQGITSSTTLSATLSSNGITLAATTSPTSVAFTTTSEVPVAPVSITSSPSSSSRALGSSQSQSQRPMTSHTSSADSGAATQGAMAVNDGRDKAVSVGATIGGIIGLFGLIALILMGIRFYMRWKRGNKRKTALMRQSWYPAGYDGPDHMLPDSNEKKQGPSDISFFSMNGKNAIAGGEGADEGSNRKSRRFPNLNVPHIPAFFPYSKNNRDVLNEDDQDFSAHDSKPLAMPAIFAGLKLNKIFPALWSPRHKPESPGWEKYADEPIYDGSQAKNRDVNPPRSIMTRPPGFDGVVGPPKLDYQPVAGHMSWGLQRPPLSGGRSKSRPNLEWGHSYAASTTNSNPRRSVMPPLPPVKQNQNRPFVPGPVIPPSPTEESVYSKRDSHRSGRESRQSRQSRFSSHSHRNRQSGQSSSTPNPPSGLDRKPSRISNPDLRSVILSRASASAASLGDWSIHSGASGHSMPALPEGGLRFDFPLPPTPSTRAPTMVSIPPPPPPKTGNRSLVPQRRPSDRKPAPDISSVFEYADYTRESTAGPASVGEGQRDTIRQTTNWYEKPLWIWDGQSGPLPRIPTDHGMLDGSDWRQSQAQQGRKSVRFDPADGVARAL